MDAAEKQHCFLSVTVIESVCVCVCVCLTHTHKHVQVSNDEVCQEIRRMPSLLADVAYRLYITRSNNF